MASGSGWYLWVWLVGVVVRRYTVFLILNPYSSCICSFLQQHPYSLFEEEEECQIAIFLFPAVRTSTCAIWRCYTLIRLEISHRTRWSCLKCVIVYIPSARYFSVCNLLRQWRISLIPTYRVYRLYDYYYYCCVKERCDRSVHSLRRQFFRREQGLLANLFKNSVLEWD